MTGSDYTIPCESPHCPTRLNPWGEWVQVDIPDKATLAFCDLRCLVTFCQHYAQDGFRSFSVRRLAEPVGT